MKYTAKYIRKAYIALLAGATPIYDMEVPKNVTPIPATRILISTQTDTQTNETKCGHDWDSTILLDVISEQQQGFVDRSVVDDIIEFILSRIDTFTLTGQDIAIAPFPVYYTKVDNITDLTLTTPTKTIVRKLIRFRHILGSVE